MDLPVVGDLVAISMSRYGDTWQDPFYLGFVQFLKVHRDDPAGKSEVGIWLCGRSRSRQSDFLTAPYKPLWIDRDDDEIRQLSRPPGTERWIQTVDGEDILEMELALDPKHSLVQTDQQALRQWVS